MGDEISASPFMEVFRKKGLEVLYMLDPEDGHVMQQLKKFDGKKIMNIEDDEEQNNLKEYVDRKLKEFEGYVDGKAEVIAKDVMDKMMKMTMMLMEEKKQS